MFRPIRLGLFVPTYTFEPFRVWLVRFVPINVSLSILTDRLKWLGLSE